MYCYQARVSQKRGGRGGGREEEKKKKYFVKFFVGGLVFWGEREREREERGEKKIEFEDPGRESTLKF